MRRIGILVSGLLGCLLVQGCGTTTRNKLVIEKPNQATTASSQSAATVAPSPYSSKGGTAAKPGTVSVQLSNPSATNANLSTARSVPRQVAKESAPAPTPVAQETNVTPITSSPVSAKSGTAAPEGTNPPPSSSEMETKPAMSAPAKTEEVPAQPAQGTKSTASPTPAPEKKPSKEMAMGKPGTSVGAVRQVNGEYKFVVIEFDSDKPLPVGTTLQIWRNGKLVGKAQLEEPLEHWPLGTASLIEGTPEKNDKVTQ